jgi:hypothetical protein
MMLTKWRLGAAIVMKPAFGEGVISQYVLGDSFERAVESFLPSGRYLFKTVQAGEVAARF